LIVVASDYSDDVGDALTTQVGANFAYEDGRAGKAAIFPRNNYLTAYGVNSAIFRQSDWTVV